MEQLLDQHLPPALTSSRLKHDLGFGQLETCKHEAVWWLEKRAKSGGARAVQNLGWLQGVLRGTPNILHVMG